METLHCCFFFVMFISSVSAASTDPLSEALLSLKSEFIDKSNTLNDWVVSQEQNPSPKIQACSWTGVKCDQDSTKITALDLSLKNLGGVLSGNQFNLFLDLIDLNISHNSFSGELPVGIFNLTSLTSLDISRNNFSGHFPIGISNLKNLTVLDAFSNSFSGSLPEDVCEIATLKVLNFAGSYFSGPIPAEYGSCKSLEFVHLAGNFLSGFLPPELGKLKTVTHMEIGYNSYQGGIPWQFGNMSELQYLDIAGANLSCLIPRELGNLTNLNTLFLFRNSLSGLIPVELSKLSLLASLDLSDNLLSGPIPESFSDLKNLRLLSLMYNDMNGSVPEGIAQLPNLESLLIWDNFFNGSLPKELGKHSKLKWLDVSTNDFDGVIPPDICSGGELTKLILFSNYFSGGLTSISNCSSLVRLRIEDNSFSGDISLNFKILSDVSYMDLSRNRFTGGIPFDLFHASRLQYFNVSNNPELGGVIPEKTWSLPLIQNFSAFSCNISGNFPEFQSCKSLSVIELDKNHLSGTIPESVSICEKLEKLNLAENNFSGQIPMTLLTSAKLQFLNVSFNDFSGSIPSKNVLRPFDSSSFLGNPNLCGAALLRPCHHGSGISEGMELGSRRTQHVAWVLILCAVVAVLTVSLIGLLYFRKRSVNGQWKMVSFTGFPQFTADEVLKSLDSMEVVAAGPPLPNSVYKAVLLTGITVTVRKIEWGTKEKHVLMESIIRIGNARHKNLNQLLGFCYNNNLGYLLYDYLPNGTLAEKIGMKRDWASKSRLVIGISRGLCFLHHECHPAIPHGDLKASNIVFDENMEAHLTEYGLKMISATEIGEYTTEMGHELNADIFNFGEVVIEILTNGRLKSPGGSIQKTPKEVLLKDIYNDNQVTSSSSSSSSKSVQEEIKLVLEVALLCTTSKLSDRPSMEDVVKILSGSKSQKK